MKSKFLLLLTMFSLLNSCQGQGNSIKEDKEYNLINTEWVEIEKIDDNFQISCSDWVRKIVINKNEITLDLMEPTKYKVSKIEEIENGFKIFISNVTWYYLFTFIDKENEICKFDYIYENEVEESFSYYAVSKSKLSNIKKQKCN